METITNLAEKSVTRAKANVSVFYKDIEKLNSGAIARLCARRLLRIFRRWKKLKKLGLPLAGFSLLRFLGWHAYQLLEK